MTGIKKRSEEREKNSYHKVPTVMEEVKRPSEPQPSRKMEGREEKVSFSVKGIIGIIMAFFSKFLKYIFEIFFVIIKKI